MITESIHSFLATSTDKNLKFHSGKALTTITVGQGGRDIVITNSQLDDLEQMIMERKGFAAKHWTEEVKQPEVVKQPVVPAVEQVAQY